MMQKNHVLTKTGEFYDMLWYTRGIRHNFHENEIFGRITKSGYIVAN